MTNKTILITGGTGSFGKEAIKQILPMNPAKLIIYSRDEFKQYELAEQYPEKDYPIHFVVGDVRDKDRLWRALDGVGYVIHAAAMKQVPACEYNPFEAIKTNVLGAQNLIECAIDRKVKKVIALGTDKQVNPINLYGATKLCAEKLFIAAHMLPGDTCFSVVRYGNVMASRGSVVPYFYECVEKRDPIPITDWEMTRFWITLPEAAQFVLQSLERMAGGEIFVPMLRTIRIVDLAAAIGGKRYPCRISGIRPGEKIHEVLISKDEVRLTRAVDGYFLIEPFSFPYKTTILTGEYESSRGGARLTIPQIRGILKKIAKG